MDYFLDCSKNSDCFSNGQTVQRAFYLTKIALPDPLAVKWGRIPAGLRFCRHLRATWRLDRLLGAVLIRCDNDRSDG
jgi:hypothetical protein